MIFVIMLMARKQDKDDFRKGMFKAKRKEIVQIADYSDDYLNILRFAPQCLQPSALVYF